MKSLQQMQQEVVDFCVAKGWSGPGSPDITFGDAMALLHSEVSEAVEAYRQWGLEDATMEEEFDHSQGSMYPAKRPGKPEGVGSEFADVFIRLLDDCDRYGIDLEAEYERKMAFNRTRAWRHGGKSL